MLLRRIAISPTRSSIRPPLAVAAAAASLYMYVPLLQSRRTLKCRGKAKVASVVWFLTLPALALRISDQGTVGAGNCRDSRIQLPLWPAHRPHRLNLVMRVTPKLLAHRLKQLQARHEPSRSIWSRTRYDHTDSLASSGSTLRTVGLALRRAHNSPLLSAGSPSFSIRRTCKRASRGAGANESRSCTARLPGRTSSSWARLPVMHSTTIRPLATRWIPTGCVC